MKVQVQRASLEQKPILGKLLQIYLEELSAINVRENKDYKYFDLYWEETERTPFIINTDNKIAGFVLVNTHTNIPENRGAKAIAEFFILKKYRRKGFGKGAAFQIFDMFSCKWEVAVPKNHRDSQKFWRRVINDYTKGSFKKRVVYNKRWKGPVYSFNS